MCAVNVIWRCLRCTPSARRATRKVEGKGGGGAISIHALREEGDNAGDKTNTKTDISIHALREEGDFTVP